MICELWKQNSLTQLVKPRKHSTRWWIAELYNTGQVISDNDQQYRELRSSDGDTQPAWKCWIYSGVNTLFCRAVQRAQHTAGYKDNAFLFGAPSLWRLTSLILINLLDQPNPNQSPQLVSKSDEFQTIFWEICWTALFPPKGVPHEE